MTTTRAGPSSPWGRGWLRQPIDIELPVAPWTGPLSWVARTIPVVMMIVGIAMAVVAAPVSQRPDGEGLGTLGVEVGAALWFGGAVTVGARRSPTVRRALLLIVTALAGASLVALALALAWSGAVLDLAMEFGIGAVAVAVIDTLLLSIIHPRLEKLADHAETTRVTIRLGGSRHVVDVRAARADAIDP